MIFAGTAVTTNMEKILIDKKLLASQIHKATYWPKPETDGTLEVVHRAINHARCQLPIQKVHDETAIFHYACYLLRIGGAEWYPVWC